MADNKKELFHWNFDLKNSDSDFTDIEYSPEVIPPADGQDDIKPFIFVDGNYNPETDADSFDESLGNSEKKATGKNYRRDDEEEDFYRGGNKKNNGKLSPASVFGNNNIPWKKILIGLAAVVVVVLLAILLWPKKETPQNLEWTENKDEKITALVEKYFDALKSGKEDDMRQVLVSEANIDWQFLANQSVVFESFSNTKIYSYPGMEEDETCLFVLSDVGFKNIATPATKSYVFYARPDKTVKALRLMTQDELTAEKNAVEKEAEASKKDAPETAFTYYSKAFSNSEFMFGIQTEADKKYNSQLSQDERLSKYVKEYEKGNFVVAPNTEPGTAGTDQTDVPPQSSDVSENTTANNEQTEPISTVSGETLLEAKAGFINDNDVRVRATPDTSSSENILGKLHFAHRILIVGQTDDWYHIKDILTEDGAGGTQDATGWEGYVSKQFVVEFYSQLQQP